MEQECSECGEQRFCPGRIDGKYPVCRECFMRMCDGTGKTNKYRAHKYGATPTDYDGIRYHSKNEARRATQLDLYLRTGELREYLRQVRVQLVEGFACVIDYLCLWKDWSIRFEDVKGCEPQRTRDIRKLWKAHGRFPLDILKWKRGQWQRESLGATTASGLVGISQPFVSLSRVITSMSAS